MLTSKLCDRYEVLHDLGSSGAVSTYVAKDTQFPNYPLCVVKRIVPTSTDPASLRHVRVYFKREAELLGMLGTHDCIPMLIDYFEDHGAFYLVQERVEGEPLDQDEIAPGHLPWPEAKAVEFLDDMLGLLQFIHDHQVIHGDIKPRSIIRRSQDEKLVLTDFDAIKLVQVPNQPISAPGTPGYRAPEQASGLHFASDIYALGITAMQAVTGVKPQHLSQDANGNIICPDNTRIREALAAVLNTMVRSDYRQRYQSAAEALAALRQIPGLSPGVEDAEALAPEVAEERTSDLRSLIPHWRWLLALIPVVVGVGYGGFALVKHQLALADQRQVLEQIEAQFAQQSFAECRELASTFPGPPSSHYAIAASNRGVDCAQQMALADQRQVLGQIEAQFTQGAWDDCIALADRFPAPPSSDYALAALNLRAECTLEKAQQLANPPETHYRDAIETAQRLFGMQVAGRSIDTAILEEARRKIDTWSDAIVAVSNRHFENFRQHRNGTDLHEAVRILQLVPAGTAAHTRIEARLQQWASEMLQTAQDQYNNSATDAEADRAIALLRLVPEGTPAFPEAQALVPRLEQHERVMRTARQNAMDALQVGRCQTAREYVAQIDQSPYTAWKAEGQALDQAVRQCLTPLSVSNGYFTAQSSEETYPFKGFKGQQVSITMISNDFTTHLTLFDPDGQMLAEDHGDIGNRSSKLRVMLNKTGEYRVRATAYGESWIDGLLNRNQRGEYSLSVTVQQAD